MTTNFKPDNNGGITPMTSASNGDSSKFDHLSEAAVPLLDDDDDDDDSSNNRTRTFDYPSKWMMVKVFVVFAILSVPCFLFVKHYGPLFMKKEVIPVIKWLVNTFSRPVLAAIIFAAISLFPILLLPTLPLKWVAGMIFGYGIGFLLIYVAVAVAVSLPYLIGYHLFYRRIKKWLDEHPREASIVRLAGDGDWFHQFKAIVLIRLAPFPYVLFNYTAVVTGVKYSSYLAGSLVGLVPEILVAIYSGILIRRLAEAVDDHTPVSRLQMILDGTGFCITLAATIVIGFFAKGKLRQLQDEEKQQQLLL